LAARVDVLFLAVPIAITADMAARVGPHVQPGACLADITSLKGAPVAAMLAATAEEVVGTHPMFGPSSGSFDRQKVVVCAGRGEVWHARLSELFAALGAEVVHATAEEHDRHMALIQVLVHEKTMVMGSVLERLGADLKRSLDFASPIYRAELSMIGRMYSQSAELYAGIVTQNPEGAKVLATFREESERLTQLAEHGDRQAIAERFVQVASFLHTFAAWARRQSDAILADLVRHG
jgi:chorismate mutase/prephenate dehydrogenase